MDQLNSQSSLDLFPNGFLFAAILLATTQVSEVQKVLQQNWGLLNEVIEKPSAKSTLEEI